MESLKVFLLLGIFAQQALCQNPAALLAMMGAGGRGGGMSAFGGMNPMALGIAGGEMGGGMQEMAMLQALTSSGSMGSSQGGSGGGIDPMTLLFLGGAGGAAPSSDLMQQMMMMNLLRGGNNQEGQSQNQGGSMASNIANLLAGPAGSNSDITPGQHNALWGAVQMSGNTQRVMDAISQPTDRIALERDGLPGLNPMMTMSMCPRPNRCGFTFCENAEIPFTGETFYVCRGCPRCPMDPAQRNMMNMMSSIGGAAGGQNMAQTMMMMRAMGQGAGGGSSSAGPMDPGMLMALMNMQQQQQQQQPTPTTSSLTIPGSPQAKPVATAVAPTSKPQKPKPKTTPMKSKPIPGPRPPREFIEAMKAMSAQMRSQKTTPAV